MIQHAVDHIHTNGNTAIGTSIASDRSTGVHLGIDPRNDEARQFYLRVGFTRIPSSSGEWYGLKIALHKLQLG